MQLPDLWRKPLIGNTGALIKGKIGLSTEKKNKQTEQV